MTTRSTHRAYAEPTAALLLGVQRVHHLDRADPAAKNAAHSNQRLQDQADHQPKRTGLNAELRNSDHPVAVLEAKESLGYLANYR